MVTFYGQGKPHLRARPNRVAVIKLVFPGPDYSGRSQRGNWQQLSKDE